ncbi:MAG TPA: hypothetical protein DCK83_04090 [Gallionellaceae bacterium]|nr:hypothetical protein [Gallionellaceae bacterium]
MPACRGRGCCRFLTCPLLTIAVIPAQAGIQRVYSICSWFCPRFARAVFFHWIPACAGMTI